MNLDEVKLFLRIDSTDEDTFLQSLITAAEEYLTNAGVIKDYTRELYKLAIKILVAHWYENRNVIGSVSNELQYSLGSIIPQLKYCTGSGTV